MMRKACLIVKHMKDYREVVKKINDQQKEYEELRKAGGISIGTTFKSAYGQGGSSSKEKSVDELTTVSSNELIGQYDDEQDKSDAEKCIEDAASDSDSCKKFFAIKSKGNQEQLVLDYELKSMALVSEYDKEMDLLDDDIKVKEFLQSKGNTRLVQDLDDGISIDDIKLEMRERFKAERMAIVNQLRKKIKDREATSKTGDKVVKDEAANKVKDRKEKLRGLYHYTNIVSSYLTLEDKDGNTVGDNSVGFLAERSERDDQDAEAEKYFKSLQPESFKDKSSSESSARTSIDLNFIDQFLHNSIKEKKTK
jgi:hypothetical protein